MNDLEDIAQRIQRYFARQIAWLEIQRADLSALPDVLEGPVLEGVVLRQAQRERESAEFLREQQGLLREWQAATVSAAEQAEVRVMAARAEALAEELRDAYDRAVKHLDAAADSPRKSLDTVKRGRRMLDSYRPEDSGSSDFLNRRA